MRTPDRICRLTLVMALLGMSTYRECVRAQAVEVIVVDQNKGVMNRAKVEVIGDLCTPSQTATRNSGRFIDDKVGAFFQCSKPGTYTFDEHSTSSAQPNLTRVSVTLGAGEWKTVTIAVRR